MTLTENFPAETPLCQQDGLNCGNDWTRLLTWGITHGRMDPATLDRIQSDCLDLLALLCREYTGGQSSSLPQECAEDLLHSILFTLQIWLKGFADPEAALTALTQQPIKSGYEAGFARIKRKVQATRQFWSLAQCRFLETANEIYNGTFQQAIPGFFQVYDPRFGAHRTHITADYPALLFPQSLEGIEFIQQYAKALDYENRFCCGFEAAQIKRALTLYAIEYDTTVQNLYANLSQVILSAALGCVLAKEAIEPLSLSASGRNRLKQLLTKNRGVTLADLLSAFEIVADAAKLFPGPAAYFRQAILTHEPIIRKDLCLLAQINYDQSC